MRINEEIKLVSSLSWRNIWRNKRRSFLTFLTVMVGCSLIIFMRSFQNGSYSQMIEDSITPQIGHIQVHEKGFWKNRTLEYAFRNDGLMMKKIRSMEHVKAAAPRISAGGLLFFKDLSAGSEILAIEPEHEKSITNMHKFILPGGRYLQSGDTRSVVLGSILAANLKVKPGDTVSMMSQGFDGSIAAESFLIVGVFKSPNLEYNRWLALIPFAEGVRVFSMENYISSWVVRADDIDTVAEVAASIKKMTGPELEVMTWDELMPEIMQFIAMDRAGAHFYALMLYLIVAFGILNTIQMSVFERIRELGIMLSIGTSRRRVLALIMTESFFIVVIGIAAGMAGGALLSLYFTVYPMDYTGYQEEMELYGMSTLLYYAKMKPYDFYVTSAITFAISMIFAFFPARRASRLSPLRAIRHL